MTLASSLVKASMAALVGAGALLFALPWAPAVDAGATPDFGRIDAYVRSELQAAHIPGASIGLVEGDRVVHVASFGQADSTGRQVTATTPFIIGSLSKSFTAMAVMQLVGAGRIQLDAPVRTYIPWFQVNDPQASTTITVRQLLNQDSGIPKGAVAELQAGTGRETIEDSVRRLSQVKLAARPGTTWIYSNENYVTLGLAVQMVSGQPYAEYVQTHILSPLQMTHSFASAEPATNDGLASGHVWFFGYPLERKFPYETSLLPAGYIESSAEDMSHFLAAQLNGGAYAGGQVISSEGLQTMHHGVAAVDSSNRYAMGWSEGPVSGAPAFWHGGAAAGYASHMILLPGSQVGIVVLTNSYNVTEDLLASTPQFVAEGIASMMLGKNPRSTTSLGTMYLVLDALWGLLLALAFWRLVRAVRRRNRPFPAGRLAVILGVGLPLVLDVAVGLGIFGVLVLSHPAVLLFYALDLAIWAGALAGVLLVTAILKVSFAASRSRMTTAQITSPEETNAPVVLAG